MNILYAIFPFLKKKGEADISVSRNEQIEGYVAPNLNQPVKPIIPRLTSNEIKYGLQGEGIPSDVQCKFYKCNKCGKLNIEFDCMFLNKGHDRIYVECLNNCI